MRKKRVARQPDGRIYVARTLGHLKTSVPGDKSWWCVERNALIGELGVIYVVQRGLSVLFRRGADRTVPEPFCSVHGLTTADVEILGVLQQPVSFSDMRSHRRLSSLPALQRSFQRRSFPLAEPHLSEIVKIFGFLLQDAEDDE